MPVSVSPHPHWKQVVFILGDQIDSAWIQSRLTLAGRLLLNNNLTKTLTEQLTACGKKNIYRRAVWQSNSTRFREIKHFLEDRINRIGETHPAQALDTDVIGVRPARRPVDDSVPELIVGRAAGHPAEQLTSVLHQD